MFDAHSMSFHVVPTTLSVPIVIWLSEKFFAVSVDINLVAHDHCQHDIVHAFRRKACSRATVMNVSQPVVDHCSEVETRRKNAARIDGTPNCILAPTKLSVDPIVK